MTSDIDRAAVAEVVAGAFDAVVAKWKGSVSLSDVFAEVAASLRHPAPRQAPPLTVKPWQQDRWPQAERPAPRCMDDSACDSSATTEDANGKLLCNQHAASRPAFKCSRCDHECWDRRHKHSEVGCMGDRQWHRGGENSEQARECATRHDEAKPPPQAQPTLAALATQVRERAALGWAPERREWYLAVATALEAAERGRRSG